MIRGLLFSFILFMSGAAFAAGAPPPAAPAAVPPVAAAAPVDPAPAPAAPVAPSVPTPAENVLGEAKKPEETAEGDAEKPKEEAEAEKPKEEAAKPEAIKYEFKAPEGVEYDADAIKSLTEILTADGVQVSQEAANKLIDVANQHIEKQVMKSYENWAELQNQWVAEIKKDPEIGGKNFDAMSQVCAVGLEHVCMDPKTGQVNQQALAELKQSLISTGAGNNPHIVRAFYRMSKAVTEGAFVNGGAPKQEKSAASRMYPGS